VSDVPSIARYVGSKVDLLGARPDLFPMPAHGGGVAVPFLGGGSVAAFYAARGHRVIASDINARLVNAHVRVRDDAETTICTLGYIAGTLRDDEKRGGLDGARTFFESMRGKLDDGDATLRAARFLFILRAGFNGLYRENEAGECTTAYGKPKPTKDLVQADRLRAYSAAIQGVEFLCEDFAITCARALPGWAAYLDSPYEGTYTGYAGGDWSANQASLPGMGRKSERERLAAMLVYLDGIGARFSNSDSDSSTTRRLYERWRFESVSRSGQVNSNGEDRGTVNEGLWRNWQ